MNSATVQLFSIFVLCLKITQFHLPKPFFFNHTVQPKTNQMAGKLSNLANECAQVCTSELRFSLSSGPSMSFNVAFNFLCGVILLMVVGVSRPHKEVEERNEGKVNKEEKEAWKNNLTKLNK